MTTDKTKNEAEHDRIINRYDELFGDEKNLYAIADRLDQMAGDPDVEHLRGEYCNEILYQITAGYIEYPEHKRLKENGLVQLLIEQVKHLPQDEYLFHMMSAYYRNNEKQVYQCFDKMVDWMRDTLDGKQNEVVLVEFLLEPLKNAYPGFWSYAQKKTAGLWESDGTDSLCQLMANIYERNSDDEAVDHITAYLQKYPEIVTAREYLGLMYINVKMWNNAIAALEGVTVPVVFATNMADYYFALAWCYGKIKDYRNEEDNYRKALEENPVDAFTLNNLGYCLYKQRKYLEAKDVFEQCMADERDISYAASNYVRTLIALGRNKDAKDFIKQSKYKISKDLKERVKKLPPTNKRLSSKTTDYPVESIDENDEAIKPLLEVKTQQFSNEKVLEDELTSRIESGIPVFGKNLKVYKRKGEYGRQYIIPIGRLDLLCEDNEGELYIIELKKDSGYDDAYEQTARYLEWFNGSSKFKNKRVNGIICLNNPSTDLVDKIHKDNRMRLFEYQISYTEL